MSERARRDCPYNLGRRGVPYVLAQMDGAADRAPPVAKQAFDLGRAGESPWRGTRAGVRMPSSGSCAVGVADQRSASSEPGELEESRAITPGRFRQRFALPSGPLVSFRQADAAAARVLTRAFARYADPTPRS